MTARKVTISYGDQYLDDIDDVNSEAAFDAAYEACEGLADKLGVEIEITRAYHDRNPPRVSAERWCGEGEPGERRWDAFDWETDYELQERFEEAWAAAVQRAIARDTGG